GCLAQRSTATTIRTARSTATWVRYGDRHRPSSGEGCRRNRSGELLPCYVGRSLLYAAPIDYCVGVEVAVDRQGETWSACIHAISHHPRKDLNNPSLRAPDWGSCSRRTQSTSSRATR